MSSFFNFIILSMLTLSATAVSIANSSSSNDHDCHAVLAASGIRSLDRFMNSSRHGTHSMTVEALREFIDPNLESDNYADNNIPTANTNLSPDQPLVLPHAPLAGYSDEFQGYGFKLMDFILRNTVKGKDFMIQGDNVLELIGHELHMQEHYLRAGKVYRRMKEGVERPPGRALCGCLNDDAFTGIVGRMEQVARKLRNYYSFREHREEKERTWWVPQSLEDSESWELYKVMNRESTQSDEELHELATYLYCRLNYESSSSSSSSRERRRLYM